MLRRLPKLPLLLLILILFITINVLWNNQSSLPTPHLISSITTLRSLFNSHTHDYMITKSNTTPSFYFSGPEKQTILEHMRKTGGTWIPTLNVLIKEICQYPCNISSGLNSPLMIDVGSNVGMYTLYTLAMGCRVMAFEPLPEAFYFMKLSVFLNGWAHKAELYQYAVGAFPQNVVMTDVSDWRFSVVGDEKTKSYYQAEMIGLEDYIKEDVLLLKISVDGYEDEVMKGVITIMDEYVIENIVIEFSKSRDVKFKREIIKELLNEYVGVSFAVDWEIYGPRADNFREIDCVMLKNLRKEEWVPYEYMWFIRKGSQTYERASKRLKCLM